MARGLSSSVKTELATGSIDPVLLIEIGFSTPIYLTNASFDIASNISGTSRTYVSNGHLRSITGVNETNRPTKNTLSISLSGVDQTYISVALNENIINDNVFVYLTSTGGGANVVAANFGQRPFKYQNAGTNRPADDYKALCTQNIEGTFGANENEDEDKNDPSKYFDIATYIGTATSRDITGLGFQPDLVWIKSRDVTYDHASFDKIRGVNKRLRVNKSDQEGTDTQT